MKRMRLALAGGATAVLLAGCADLYRYERTTDRGAIPFTQALATEYQGFWTFEANEMYDWIDAEHFSIKARSAARGETPLPERVERWDIAPPYRNDLQAGRERLMRALDGGGRERAPAIAARAQVAYDCWVEQQEEGWQTEHIAACRSDFEKAMAALEGQLTPPPAPIARAAPAPAVAANEFRVFFDWDKATLDQTALQVLDTATSQMRLALMGGSTPGAVAGTSATSSSPRVTIAVVEGHADKSGANAYNMGLSERRAQAVRDALIQRGWPAERIEIRAMGEEEPLVETADGVREPANRRVRIALETR